MIPGRELDAKVFEALYGVKPRYSAHVDFCDPKTGIEVPRVSTDRSETFRLLDALAKREAGSEDPRYFQIMTPIDPKEGWVVTVHWAHHDGTIPVAAAKGLTVSHAVCLAILDSGIHLPYPPNQDE